MFGGGGGGRMTFGVREGRWLWGWGQREWWSGLVVVGCRFGSCCGATKDGKGGKDEEECGFGSLVWV